jgi:peptide-methionine (S)-S-oxide reductase
MGLFSRKPLQLPDAADALPGRDQPIATAERHLVTSRPLHGPCPPGSEIAYFALGCYWGAERRFWQIPGVWVTAAGNMGGFTPNPTYEEVCSGLTGHAETVMVVYQPGEVSFDELLKVFWESHDPTQGMRQGNDTGTQYRSAIYWTSEAQRAAAERSRDAYQAALRARGHGPITTEMAPAGPFYFAEAYHQQYLARNPMGYCGLAGTGVTCPVGAADATTAGTSPQHR